MDFPHLLPETAALLDRSVPERRKVVRRGTWFATRYTQQAFAAMDALPAAAALGQPAHLLVSMDYANGLSALFKAYAARHNEPEAASPTPHTPVLGPVPLDVLGRSCLSNLGLHWLLLDVMGLLDLENLYPNPADILPLLAQQRVRWLLMEGVGPLARRLEARHAPWWRAVLAQCQGLGIHLVVGCQPDTGRQLLAHPELAASFGRLSLPLWQPGEEFRALLGEFERRLPLRQASHLAAEPLAGRLYEVSRGRLALLAAILAQATDEAIGSGRERITPRQLQSEKYQSLADFPGESFG